MITFFFFDIIYKEINKNVDHAYFVNSNNPWFNRGGDHPIGLNAGVFAFESTNGYANSIHSFRVVLHTIFKNKFKNNQKE